MQADQSTDVKVHIRSVICSAHTWTPEETEEYGCWYAREHMLRDHPGLLEWLDQTTPGWGYDVVVFPNAPESPVIIRPVGKGPLSEISVSLKFKTTTHALQYKMVWGIQGNSSRNWLTKP